MRTLLSLLFLAATVSAAPKASAQDLQAMFQEAYGYLQPMQALYAPPPYGLNPQGVPEAVRRIDAISAVIPEVANAVFQATQDPTEEQRVKVCQLTSRLSDMFFGLNHRDGFDQINGTFSRLSQSIANSRRALFCADSQPSFCPAPLNRTMKTVYIATNGQTFDADISMQMNGTNTGTGTYTVPGQFQGSLREISCFDNGHTIKAKWSTGMAEGFLKFYFLDPANKKFIGSWGDFSIGSENFQNFWDGETVEGGSMGSTGANIADGVYNLKLRNSGKCLDVSEHSLDNAARIQQWACTGEAHQAFRVKRVRDNLYSLQGVQSNRCVSAQEVHYEDGTPVIQWDCANGPDQLVRFVPNGNGTYALHFSHSDKCLEISGSSFNDGDKAHQWSCNRQGNQDWSLTPAQGTATPSTGSVNPAQRYALTSRQSGKCLDAVDGKTENVTPFQQWDCNQSGAQAFHFRDVGQGFYNLVHDASGRCVSAEAVKLDNGTSMILWDCNGGPDQKVRLQASVGGTQKVIFQHSNKCMEVEGAASHNSARIQQWDCNGGGNQDWILRPF